MATWELPDCLSLSPPNRVYRFRKQAKSKYHKVIITDEANLSAVFHMYKSITLLVIDSMSLEQVKAEVEELFIQLKKQCKSQKIVFLYSCGYCSLLTRYSIDHKSNVECCSKCELFLATGSHATAENLFTNLLQIKEIAKKQLPKCHFFPTALPPFSIKWHLNQFHADHQHCCPHVQDAVSIKKLTKTKIDLMQKSLDSEVHKFNQLVNSFCRESNFPIIDWSKTFLSNTELKERQGNIVKKINSLLCDIIHTIYEEECRLELESIDNFSSDEEQIIVKEEPSDSQQSADELLEESIPSAKFSQDTQVSGPVGTVELVVNTPKLSKSTPTRASPRTRLKKASIYEDPTESADKCTSPAPSPSSSSPTTRRTRNSLTNNINSKVAKELFADRISRSKARSDGNETETTQHDSPSDLEAHDKNDEDFSSLTVAVSEAPQSNIQNELDEQPTQNELNCTTDSQEKLNISKQDISKPSQTVMNEEKNYVNQACSSPRDGIGATDHAEEEIGTKSEDDSSKVLSQTESTDSSDMFIETIDSSMHISSTSEINEMPIFEEKSVNSKNVRTTRTNNLNKDDDILLLNHESLVINVDSCSPVKCNLKKRSESSEIQIIEDSVVSECSGSDVICISNLDPNTNKRNPSSKRKITEICLESPISKSRRRHRLSSVESDDLVVLEAPDSGAKSQTLLATADKKSMQEKSGTNSDVLPEKFSETESVENGKTNCSSPPLSNKAPSNLLAIEAPSNTETDAAEKEDTTVAADENSGAGVAIETKEDCSDMVRRSRASEEDRIEPLTDDAEARTVCSTTKESSSCKTETPEETDESAEYIVVPNLPSTSRSVKEAKRKGRSSSVCEIIPKEEAVSDDDVKPVIINDVVCNDRYLSDGSGSSPAGRNCRSNRKRKDSSDRAASPNGFQQPGFKQADVSVFKRTDDKEDVLRVMITDARLSALSEVLAADLTYTNCVHICSKNAIIPQMNNAVKQALEETLSIRMNVSKKLVIAVCLGTVDIIALLSSEKKDRPLTNYSPAEVVNIVFNRLNFLKRTLSTVDTSARILLFKLPSTNRGGTVKAAIDQLNLLIHHANRDDRRVACCTEAPFRQLGLLGAPQFLLSTEMTERWLQTCKKLLAILEEVVRKQAEVAAFHRGARRATPAPPPPVVKRRAGLQEGSSTSGKRLKVCSSSSTGSKHNSPVVVLATAKKPKIKKDFSVHEEKFINVHKNIVCDTPKLGGRSSSASSACEVLPDAVRTRATTAGTGSSSKLPSPGKGPEPIYLPDDDDDVVAAKINGYMRLLMGESHEGRASTDIFDNVCALVAVNRITAADGCRLHAEGSSEEQEEESGLLSLAHKLQGVSTAGKSGSPKLEHREVISIIEAVGRAVEFLESSTVNQMASDVLYAAVMNIKKVYIG